MDNIRRGKNHRGTTGAKLRSRRESEDALRESEERFRLLVEGIKDYAIFMIDPRGYVISWNTGAQRIKGYRAEEIIGKHFSVFYPSEDVKRGKPEQELKRAMVEGSVADEGWRVRKDGSRFWANVIISALRDEDGTLLGFSKVTRDIIEGKRAEERLRMVVEAAPSAIIMVDQEGGIVLVNGQVESLFGYARDQLVGQPIEMLVPLRFRSRHPGLRAGFFTDPRARPMGAGRDLFGLKKNGSEVPIEIGLNPIPTAEGMFVLASIIDITERKRAEERLRLVVEAAPNAMIMVDKQGCITLVNTQTETLFGYKRQELLGKVVEMLVPERFRARHPNFRGSFFADPQARPMGAGRELFGLKKNGNEVPIEIGLNPLTTSEGTFVLASIIDISERKRAEERLRLVVEAAPNAMIMVNPEGKMTLVNAQTEVVFGYTRQELIGHPIEILIPERFRSRHPSYRDSFFGDPKVRAMGAGRDLFGQRRDGSEVPIEIGLNPITTSEGLFVLASIIDITQRKRGEEEIHKLNAELEQRVIERTAQLEAASQAKDRFLASMSHELRTPLNAIIGFTGTLLMKLPGPLTPDQEKQLKTTQTSAKHLLSLINDLLDLAKIESGKVELKLEPVAAQQVLEEAANALRPMAEQKGLRFVVQMPAEEITINTDRRALSQILLNLTNNAIKFTKQGEVRLELKQRRNNNHPATEFSVTDTGIGIRPEEQSKLFEAFTQVDTASGHRQEGTGLGLNLSRKLAHLLGSYITFQSEWGKGSTFMLAIPKK